MNSKNNSNSINEQGEPIFPSKLCPKDVTDNVNAILCDLCQTRVHIKYNYLNYMDYKYLQVVMNHDIACLVPMHSFYLVI